MTLPVARPWFRRTPMGPGLARITEPHTDPMVSANIWHVHGAARDLVFDTGLGVGCLRAEHPELFARDPLVVVSHAHLDHMGGAHEFDGVHASAAEDWDHPLATLRGAQLAEGLGLGPQDWGPDGVPDLLIDAVPAPGWDPEGYRPAPPRILGALTEGDVLDLGDRRFVVLALPGHTPGSLALWEERERMLLSGDVVYDDVLLDDIVGADVSDYLATMRRLVDLPVERVHPGHGDSFDGERLRAIARQYTASRTGQSLPAQE